jgi:hypothetical protein
MFLSNKLLAAISALFYKVQITHFPSGYLYDKISQNLGLAKGMTFFQLLLVKYNIPSVERSFERDNHVFIFL